MLGESGEARVVRLEWMNLLRGLDEDELVLESVRIDLERGVARESTLLFLLLILWSSGESRQDSDNS